MANLCCPHCGNRNIQATTETDVKTTGKNYSAGKGCLGFLLLGPLGLLCGACGEGQKTTSTTTSYWVCPNCGTKFRNPQEIQEEAEKLKGQSSFAIGFAIVTLILVVFLLIIIALFADGSADDFVPFIIVAGIIIIVAFGGLSALNKSTAEKLEGEANDLDYRMNKYKDNVSVQNFSNNRGIAENSSTSWICACGTKNPADSKFCMECGSKKVIQKVVAPWQCSCGTENTGASKFCLNCGNKKPAVQYSKSVFDVEIGSDQWRCPDCGTVNQNYVGTCGCGTRKP